MQNRIPIALKVTIGTIRPANDGSSVSRNANGYLRNAGVIIPAIILMLVLRNRTVIIITNATVVKASTVIHAANHRTSVKEWMPVPLPAKVPIRKKARYATQIISKEHRVVDSCVPATYMTLPVPLLMI